MKIATLLKKTELTPQLDFGLSTILVIQLAGGWQCADIVPQNPHSKSGPFL